MMHFSKRTKTIGIIVLVGLVVIVAWTIMRTSEQEAGQADTQPRVTREDAPNNIEVPEVGSAITSAAVPIFTGPAGPRTDSKLRAFTAVATNNAFSPNKFIVREGDTVRITMQAVDHDYDFTQPDYGFKVAIPKGQTKTIEFSATAPGTFTFYCAMCENNKTHGSIIISPQ